MPKRNIFLANFLWQLFVKYIKKSHWFLKSQRFSYEQLLTIVMYRLCLNELEEHHELTLSWRRPLSYRNQSIDLQSKSKDWFLYDNGPRHVRVNTKWVHNIAIKPASRSSSSNGAPNFNEPFNIFVRCLIFRK